jgi:hypothetical protein
VSDAPVEGGVGHRHRFVGRYVLLLLALLVVLSSFGMLSPETFFIGAFIGYLLLVEITTSSYLHPRWREPLRWPARVGYVIFGLLALRYFVTIARTGMG